VYWGIGLIGLGLLWLVDSLGLLPFDLSGVVFPILLILAGIWVIWGLSGTRRGAGTTALRTPLEDASSLELDLRHMGGRLRLDGSTTEPDVLTAEFATAARHETARSGGMHKLRLRPADDWAFLTAPWAWQPGDPPHWAVHIPTTVPARLQVQTNAAEAVVDLSAVELSGLHLRTNASACVVTLPRPRGVVPVRIEGNATAIRIRLDPATAAQITAHADLGTIHADPGRFSQVGPVYTTADLDRAVDRYEVTIRVRAGSAELTVADA
jgi:hypothetical protein